MILKLTEWMESRNIVLWGMADLRHFPTPADQKGIPFPFAVSFGIPMDPSVMDSIQKGPNHSYADEYTRVNKHINEISEALASEIEKRGFQSRPVAASVRPDQAIIEGEFPHKTAATRAGLGWIGIHCQLITHPFGPWVRLGTVFTDVELECGIPLEKNLCGNCRKCVEACPAKAIKGSKWYPGLALEEMLDVQACDQWRKEHYFQFHNGHICGICSAVCPHGQTKK